MRALDEMNSSRIKLKKEVTTLKYNIKCCQERIKEYERSIKYKQKRIDSYKEAISIVEKEVKTI